MSGIYGKHYRKHINTSVRQTESLFKIKEGGTYRNNGAKKG